MQTRPFLDPGKGALWLHNVGAARTSRDRAARHPHLERRVRTYQEHGSLRVKVCGQLVARIEILNCDKYGVKLLDKYGL
jgi:hypothetical protein